LEIRKHKTEFYELSKANPRLSKEEIINILRQRKREKQENLLAANEKMLGPKANPSNQSTSIIPKTQKASTNRIHQPLLLLLLLLLHRILLKARYLQTIMIITMLLKANISFLIAVGLIAWICYNRFFRVRIPHEILFGYSDIALIIFIGLVISLIPALIWNIRKLIEKPSQNKWMETSWGKKLLEIIKIPQMGLDLIANIIIPNWYVQMFLYELYEFFFLIHGLW
jgi:hypothetical protein